MDLLTIHKKRRRKNKTGRDGMTETTARQIIAEEEAQNKKKPVSLTRSLLPPAGLAGVTTGAFALAAQTVDAIVLTLPFILSYCGSFIALNAPRLKLLTRAASSLGIVAAGVLLGYGHKEIVASEAAIERVTADLRLMWFLKEPCASLPAGKNRYELVDARTSQVIGELDCRPVMSSPTPPEYK